MRTQLEENQQNAAKFHITETKTNTNRGQPIEGSTAASIVKRERASERARELARCVAISQQTTSGFVLGGKGREGEDDNREKEISIAKKIYLKFKGLKLYDFGDFQ
jgi:hypothetical protein